MGKESQDLLVSSRKVDIRLLWTLWTFSMRQRPFWEADSHTVTQKLPVFYRTRGALLSSQEPATGLFLEPDEFVWHPPTLPHFKFHFCVVKFVIIWEVIASLIITYDHDISSLSAHYLAVILLLLLHCPFFLSSVCLHWTDSYDSSLSTRYFAVMPLFSHCTALFLCPFSVCNE